MIYELVYTSAPQGLFPGNTGFAVVGCTRNMDYAICKQLENLSAYTPLYPHYDGNAWNNPVNCAHRIIQVNGIEYHILSRICFNGLDYTQRSNKLASHIAISADELQALPSGPASIFQQETLFKDEKWQIRTEYFANPPIIMDLQQEVDVCKNWQQLTGDSGWAGVIAESYLSNPLKNIYIIFDPLKSKQNISLMSEVLSLLPVHLRWQLTFSTYFTELPAGVTCNVRFCVSSCDALQKAKQNPNGNLIIDLTEPMPQATGGELVAAAKTGRMPLPQPPMPNNPVNPMNSVPFPPSAQPTIIIQQNGAMKAAMIAASVALVILGIVFLSTKLTDNTRIQNIQKQSDKNEDLALQAVKGLYDSLRIQIQYLQKIDKVTFPTPSITAELPKKAEYLIATHQSKTDKESAKKKPLYINAQKSAEILYVYDQINKKIANQQKLLAELEPVLKISQQEEDLVQNIKKYVSLSKQIKFKAPYPLSYTPKIDHRGVEAAVSMVQGDIQTLQKSRYSLRKHFTTVKFPAIKNINAATGLQIITVAQAWSVQKDLLNALKNNKVFAVEFSDLLPDASIKTVYNGQDSIENSKGVYTFINNEKLKLNISLKNKTLRIKKTDNKAVDLSGLKISIQIEDKKNQFVNLFIEENTQLPFDETIYFYANDDRLCYRFRIPEGIDPSNIDSSLQIKDKKIALKVKGQYWETTEKISVPNEVATLTKAWALIKQERAKIEKNIKSGFFSHIIENTKVYKDVYDKSPKKAEDKKRLLKGLLEDTEIKELRLIRKLENLGISEKLETYKEMNIIQVQESIIQSISEELAKAWQGKTQIHFSCEPSSWKQVVDVKNIAGDN